MLAAAAPPHHGHTRLLCCRRVHRSVPASTAEQVGPCSSGCPAGPLPLLLLLAPLTQPLLLSRILRWGVSPCSCLQHDNTTISLTVLKLVNACVEATAANVTILGPNSSALDYLVQVSQDLKQLQPAQNSNSSSAPVRFLMVPFQDWVKNLLALASGSPALSKVSGYLIDPIVRYELLVSDLLDLSQILPTYPQVDWAGIHPFFRNMVVNVPVDGSSTQQTITSLPFGGMSHQMFYRQDLLDLKNLSVPETWDDLLAAVAAVNGTVLGPGQPPIFGFCTSRQTGACGCGCGGVGRGGGDLMYPEFHIISIVSGQPLSRLIMHHLHHLLFYQLYWISRCPD